MAEFPFVNKNGQIFYYNADGVENTKRTFIVIKKDEEILCMCDETAQMYTLPTSKDVSLDMKNTEKFETIAYVIRADTPAKERQTYKIYDVKDVELKDMPLAWVKLPDVLFDEVVFDATLKSGMKNLAVRGK